MEPAITADPTAYVKKLEEISHQMTRLSGEYRRYFFRFIFRAQMESGFILLFRVLDDLRESVTRQQEKFQKEKDSAVLAARVEAQVAALGTDGNNTDSTLQQIDTDNQKKVIFFYLQINIVNDPEKHLCSILMDHAVATRYRLEL